MVEYFRFFGGVRFLDIILVIWCAFGGWIIGTYIVKHFRFF